MNTIWIIGGALGLFSLWMFEADPRWIVAGGLALLAWTFNSIVNAKNQAESAFSSVHVMLKKRWDLVPNLVATVQQYADHESKVLEEVTRLRSAAVSAGTSAERAIEADNALGRALSRLIATAESYPELKASDNFQQLQRALNEVEEQISASRRTYNATVKQLNDSLRMFPTNVLARLAGYTERPYFEIAASETERPDVAAQFRAGRSR